MGIWLYFFIGFSVSCFVLWLFVRGNCWRTSCTNSNEPSRFLNTYKTDQHIYVDQEIALVKKESHIQILLLYPKETGNFQNLMDAFRNLLNLYVFKVWDPNDEESIESVAENWWQWLEKVLKIPSLKVIVVETEKCKEWLSKDFQQDSIQTHYLEGIFYYALARLKEDLLFSRDYTRLFRIRFDSSESSERISLIVPFTCYEMPQHLSNLIGDILELRPFKVCSTTDVSVKETRLFSEAMRQYGLINV